MNDDRPTPRTPAPAFGSSSRTPTISSPSPPRPSSASLLSFLGNFALAASIIVVGLAGRLTEEHLFTLLEYVVIAKFGPHALGAVLERVRR